MKNAFSAFGFEADDATIDTLRTDLAFALRQFIERSQLGQVRVGKVLGLKQSVVSKIVRGDIKNLSVERLIRAMVNAKITGFAEWGESPELARAGAGFRIASTATIVFTVPAGTPYFTDKLPTASNVGDLSANFDLPSSGDQSGMN
ncbi:MAG TPA: XRE family transcriptional regulator [Gammaproteobacteria bacterium]|nr:XRE family transcriptional regulator [Gammaproteobacteria bacterium]